jgi:hypothetical protein
MPGKGEINQKSDRYHYLGYEPSQRTGSSLSSGLGRFSFCHKEYAMLPDTLFNSFSDFSLPSEIDFDLHINVKR